jgi:hypothetical protein
MDSKDDQDSAQEATRLIVEARDYVSAVIICRSEGAFKALRGYALHRSIRFVKTENFMAAASVLRQFDSRLALVFVVESGDPEPPALDRASVLRPPEGHKFSYDEVMMSDLADIAYMQALDDALARARIDT